MHVCMYCIEWYICHVCMYVCMVSIVSIVSMVCMVCMYIHTYLDKVNSADLLCNGMLNLDPRVHLQENHSGVGIGQAGTYCTERGGVEVRYREGKVRCREGEVR